MSRRNAVHRAFDAFGKTHFREKRSGWWVRGSDGVEQRLNLQKSQWSLSYYLNFEIDFGGVVPAELAVDESDLGYPFAIEGRVDAFLSETDVERLRGLLDVEGVPMPEEQREHQLLLFLEEKLAPRLRELSSLAVIAEYDRNGLWAGFGVYRSARRVLDALAAS